MCNYCVTIYTARSGNIVRTSCKVAIPAYSNILLVVFFSYLIFYRVIAAKTRPGRVFALYRTNFKLVGSKTRPAFFGYSR